MKLTVFKILLLLLSILTSNVNSFSQSLPGEKFREGTNLYSAGNYEEALQAWLDLYNTGYSSAELMYNIGNTYFKMNDIPSAVLFYERARLRKPGDEDINYNLQIARILVMDRFEEIPVLFFIRWYDFLALARSTNSWAKISLSAFILSLLFLSVYFFTSKYNIKVAAFWLALALFIISFSTLSLSVRNRNLVTKPREAIIFEPQVNGKSSPDDSGTDLFVLHEGTKVMIEDEVGEWFEIRLSDGNKGWIPSNSMEII